MKSKSLRLAAIVVAALAVVPAAASAAPRLYAGGTALPNGEAVTGVSTSFNVLGGPSAASCSGATIGASVKNNDGVSQPSLTVDQAATSARCTSQYGDAWVYLEPTTCLVRTSAAAWLMSPTCGSGRQYMDVAFFGLGITCRYGSQSSTPLTWATSTTSPLAMGGSSYFTEVTSQFACTDTVHLDTLFTFKRWSDSAAISIS